jgi:hypothetical protein
MRDLSPSGGVDQPDTQPEGLWRMPDTPREDLIHWDRPDTSHDEPRAGGRRRVPGASIIAALLASGGVAVVPGLDGLISETSDPVSRPSISETFTGAGPAVVMLIPIPKQERADIHAVDGDLWMLLIRSSFQYDAH